MERLKELGTWVLLVILFYLFSNGIIYLFLNKGEGIKQNQPRTSNSTINETR